MDSTTQFLAITVILGVLVLNAITIVVRRRGVLPMRRLRALEHLPFMMSADIESGRSTHFSMGHSAIGTDDTMLALSSADFIMLAAQSATVGDAPPIITTSATSTIPLAIDTVRRAYQLRDRLTDFQPVQARWYPQGVNSLAYAGAITALQADDKLGGNVLVGRFGAELALITFGAQRHEQAVIAGSDRLTGQAVAYAMADAAVIGEELFALPGYMSEQPHLAHRNITLDIVRGLLIAGIVGLTVITLLNGS